MPLSSLTIDSWKMFSVQESMRPDPIAFRLLALVALTAFLLNPLAGRAQEESPYERIAALAHGSPMITVGEGLFFMGTARTGHDLYGLDLPYDDTEQPQRRVWLGGSWKSAPPLLRTATRSGAAPEQRTATVGFRCAKSIR